jgi:hypothetical protein
MALCIAVSFSLSAQTKVLVHEFSQFDGIDVSDCFETEIRISDSYRIRVTVSDQLADYLQTYVKGRILYLKLDDKAIPHGIKRLFKGKNAIPEILKVIIDMPSVSYIKLSDRASVCCSDPVTAEKFMIEAGDKSKITDMSISAGKADIVISKNSDLKMTVSADSVKVVSSGASTLSLSQSSKSLEVNPSGSSNIKIDCDNTKINVDASGSSKLFLSGTASLLKVEASGFAKIEAPDLALENASVVLSGRSIVTEGASAGLTMDLSGNSHLIFKGSPRISIVNIKSSSVSHYVNK